MNPNNPIIVQSDRTILLEVDHPLHTEARDALAQFAEIEKSPEHIHTYRLSPLSLWNAAAGGMDAQTILDQLTFYSKYPLPSNVITEIHNTISRYAMGKGCSYDQKTAPLSLKFYITSARSPIF